MPDDRLDADDCARSFARISGLPLDLAKPALAGALGNMPANIALMQLCMAASKPREVEAAIAEAESLWGDAGPSPRCGPSGRPRPTSFIWSSACCRPSMAKARTPCQLTG